MYFEDEAWGCDTCDETCRTIFLKSSRIDDRDDEEAAVREKIAVVGLLRPSSTLGGQGQEGLRWS